MKRKIESFRRELLEILQKTAERNARTILHFIKQTRPNKKKPMTTKQAAKIISKAEIVLGVHLDGWAHGDVRSHFKYLGEAYKTLYPKMNAVKNWSWWRAKKRNPR